MRIKLFLLLAFGFLLLAIVLILYPIPTPIFALSPTCSSGSPNPRAQGLVSTPELSGKFHTPGGCTIDIKSAFAPFKIPTYDDLKSVYFTQSKASKVIKLDATIANITVADDEKVFNYTYTSSDVNVNPPGLTYTGTAVIFIEGSIYINGDIQAGDPSKGLVFVVKGNVNISAAVTRIDAAIVAEGPIYTAGAGCSSTSPVPASALTINGSLVSLNQSITSPINFCRTLSDNTQPAEVINQQAKYLVILRNIYSDTLQKWSEIQ